MSRAEIKDFTREINKLGAEVKASGEGADSALGQKLHAVGLELAEVKERAKGFNEAMKGGEKGEFLEGVKERAAEAGEAVAGVREHFLELAEIAGVAISIDAFKEWVVSSAELGEKLENVSHQLGISAEAASRLMGVAGLSGTSFDELQTQMQRLQLALAKTHEEGSAAGAALKALGVDAQQFRALAIDQQIARLAQAFAGFEDGPTKTAAAIALLRKAGADMIPFLDKGKEGMEELQRVLARTGAIMTNEMAEGFAHTKEDLSEMSLAWQGVSNKIFDVFRHAIDAALESLAKLLEAVKEDDIRNWASSSASAVSGMSLSIVEAFAHANAAMKDFIAYGDRVGRVASGLVSPFEKATKAVEGFFAAFKMSQELQDDADRKERKSLGLPEPTPSGPGGAFGTMPTGVFQGENMADIIAQNDLLAGKQISDARAKAAEYGATLAHLFDKPQQLLGEYARAKAGEDAPAKPAVPQMNLGGKAGKADHTARDDAEADARRELEAWQDNAQAKTDLLNQELAGHQITMSQWLGQTKDALADEAQDVEATYAAEIAEMKTLGATHTQIVNVQIEEAKKLKDIAHQVGEAEDKAAKDSEKSWDSAMKSINGAFDSQINGLLTGTETWRKAFTNVVKDLTEQLIKFGVNQALTGVENIGKAALGIGKSVGGDVAQTANTGALTTLNGSVWSLIGTLTGHGVAVGANTAATSTAAAATGTNVASSLANTISTDANTIATNFGAAMAGLKSALFGFARGTDYVQHTGLALIHEGEKIVPAHLNPDNPGNSLGSLGARFGAAGGSGGSSGGVTNNHSHTHNWSVNAVDSGGVRDFFHDHAEHLASALHSAISSGHHGGLAALAR